MPVKKALEVVRDYVDNRPRTVLDELAEVGRKTYCSLYTKNPGWIFVKDNFTLPIIKRWSDDLCRDEAPAPPYTPTPFAGGQCEGDNYEVTIKTVRTQNDGQVFNEQVFFDAIGKIDFAGVFPPSEATSGRTGIQCIDNAPNGLRDRIIAIYDGRTIDLKAVSIDIVNLTNSDDTCGNIIETPFPPVSEPPVEETNKYINITNNNGDDIEYFVEVQRDENNFVSYPLSIEVSGFNLTVDVGGVTIDNSKSGGGGFEPLEEEEEEEEKEEVEPPEIRVDVFSGLTDGFSRSISNITQLRVEIQQDPVNADKTAGLGSPDVQYWGWFEWENGGAYYERQFLHFENHFFVPPEKNSGYALFVKKGYIGRIVETRVIESP